MKVEVGGEKKAIKFFCVDFYYQWIFFLFFERKKNYFCTLKLLFDWFFFVVSLFSTRTERNYVSDLKKKNVGEKVKTEKKKLIGVEMFEIKKNIE